MRDSTATTSELALRSRFTRPEADFGIPTPKSVRGRGFKHEITPKTTPKSLRSPVVRLRREIPGLEDPDYSEVRTRLSAQTLEKEEQMANDTTLQITDTTTGTTDRDARLVIEQRYGCTLEEADRAVHVYLEARAAGDDRWILTSDLEVRTCG